MNFAFDKISNAAKAAFVTGPIVKGTEYIKTAFTECLNKNLQFTNALSRMKEALINAFMPIFNVVIPALSYLLNVLTSVISAIGRFIASLFGGTANVASTANDNAEALNEEAEAIESTDSAAKGAAGSLASFDEINTIAGPKGGGGGGGGGGGSAGATITAPETSWTDEISDRLKRIAASVLLIGTGLGLWSISSKLPGLLGQIGKGLGSILLTVGGLILAWDGLSDAWENGIDWGNLIEMIAGVGIAALGASKFVGLFNEDFAPIAAEMALIIGGIAMLVVGIKDFIGNGLTLQNTLTMLAGALGVVGGAFMAFKTTGGAIALIVTGLTLLVGGIIDFINKGLTMQNTLMMLAGAAATVAGVFLALGTTGGAITLLVAGIAALVLGIQQFLSTGEMTNQTLLMIEAGILAIGVAISLLTGNWIPALIAIVIGAVLAIITYWDEIKNFFVELWENVKETFTSAWEFIVGIWEAVAPWFLETVIEPLMRIFEPVLTFFQQLFEGAWLIVRAAWIIASSWFNANVIQPIAQAFSAFTATISNFFSDLWQSIQSVWTAVADWFSTNVTGPMKEGFSNAFEAISTIMTNVGNVLSGIINWILGKIESFINWVIGGINNLLTGFNAVATAAAKFLGVNYGGVTLIGSVALPRLATGGVIPPNREFMAILGDNKKETEVVSPLSTMKQAMLEALHESGSGGGSPIQVNLVVDGKTLAKVIVPQINNMSRTAGKPVLIN